MPFLYFFMLHALLACSALSSADVLAPIEQRLKGFDSFQAGFEQTTYDNTGEAVQSMSGTITLQKPDRFFWQSDDPYAQQLISNGKLIWHYDADLEQVVVQEYAEQLDKAPMLVILRDPGKLAENYELAEHASKNGRETFVLRARQSQAALSSVQLTFEQGKLVGLQFVDRLQQKTEVTFDNIVINPAVDASLFEFEIPEGADVLYE